ncbi:unnamed protein product [Paramecium octaurelia]|uniref:Uncharacterized protein n=1 Tax=Paramecium octaurelia TaxID=43137 RepID=A0A8S1WC72_PAROT|nr:unnamed protein product [Paramecium octaurelia]
MLFQKTSIELIIAILIFDKQVSQYERYSLYILNLNNIQYSFSAKQISVTNAKHQINYGKILVKRSASILYDQNFPLRSIQFSLLVIKFKQSSIQKNCKQDDTDSSSYAQKYTLRFSGQSTLINFKKD